MITPNTVQYFFIFNIFLKGIIIVMNRTTLFNFFRYRFNVEVDGSHSIFSTHFTSVTLLNSSTKYAKHVHITDKCMLNLIV